MNQINLKNEKTKRAYLAWRREAQGDSEKTITMRERTINLYSDYTNAADFKSFNKDKAIGFKEYLRSPSGDGKKKSRNTIRTILIHIRDFYKWLCTQPGYRRIAISEIDYLKISKQDSRIAAESVQKSIPSFEHSLKLVHSIEINDDVDFRDKAMIALIVCTGMRDSAVRTLPVSCIDIDELIVYQLPQKGVETKYSKEITSVIFPFDESLIKIIKEWIIYLKNKGFGEDDPYFPQSKLEHLEGSFSYKKPTEILPEFLQSTSVIRRVFKDRSLAAKLPYFRPHSFRDMAINRAIKYAKSNLQLKAISQNVGHEKFFTTFSSYGTLNQDELISLLRQINFKEDPDISNIELMNFLKKFYNDHKN